MSELDELDLTEAERPTIDLSEQAILLPPDLGAPSLAAAVEALLIIADEPLPLDTIAAATGRPAPTVAAELERLAAEYTADGRGFDLRQTATGWRFYSRAECSELITRHITEGQSARLSQAALETLAVIAYKQPVTRARIGAVRGVNVDGVVRTLLTRGLVEQIGTEAETGAGLYGTSEYFLERLGIDSLADLPPLAVHVPIGEELDEIIADH